MVTDPEDYLSHHYADDLAVHGANCVCGMTLHGYPSDGRADAMHDWQAFALVQYEMNLLQEAFHAYGLAVRLNNRTPGWPELRTIRCTAQSRLGHPVRILERFEHVMLEGRHPRARRFERADILQYDCWFSDLARDQLSAGDFDRLVRGVLTDPDCWGPARVAFLQRRGVERVWETALPHPGRLERLPCGHPDICDRRN